MAEIKQVVGTFIFSNPLLSMIIGAGLTVLFLAWSMGAFRKKDKGEGAGED